MSDDIINDTPEQTEYDYQRAIWLKDNGTMVGFDLWFQSKGPLLATSTMSAKERDVVYTARAAVRAWKVDKVCEERMNGFMADLEQSVWNATHKEQWVD